MTDTITGRNVSHLVALVMHQGVPGGNHMVRPVVYEHKDGMHFRLVLDGQASTVLGKVEQPYRDESELIGQIMEAHRKWGFPTVEMLEKSWPGDGRLRA